MFYFTKNFYGIGKSIGSGVRLPRSQTLYFHVLGEWPCRNPNFSVLLVSFIKCQIITYSSLSYCEKNESICVNISAQNIILTHETESISNSSMLMEKHSGSYIQGKVKICRSDWKWSYYSSGLLSKFLFL